MKNLLIYKTLVNGASAAIVATICVFGLLRYSDSQRFSIALNEHVTYKIDRKTGKTWINRVGKFVEVEDQGEGTISEILPNYIASELTGRGSYSTGSGFKGSIYNPTEYLIDSITFVVENKDSGEEKWRREFTVDVSIAPKSAGDFYFDTLDGDKAKATSWGIQTATGRKKQLNE